MGGWRAGQEALSVTGEAVTGSGDELATRLRLAVGRLSRRVRIDGGESVPPLQLSALVTVEEHGPLRLSELARREAVTAPTMSRVLSALDEQGLVVRSPDPQDARGVLITLSAGGRPPPGRGPHPTHGAHRAQADPPRRRTAQRPDRRAARLEALLVDDERRLATVGADDRPTNRVRTRLLSIRDLRGAIVV